MNRDGKGPDKRAERATAQSGAMPYHRVADAFKDNLHNVDEHLPKPAPTHEDSQHLPHDHEVKS